MRCDHFILLFLIRRTKEMGLCACYIADCTFVRPSSTFLPDKNLCQRCWEGWRVTVQVSVTVLFAWAKLLLPSWRSSEREKIYRQYSTGSYWTPARSLYTRAKEPIYCGFPSLSFGCKTWDNAVWTACAASPGGEFWILKGRYLLGVSPPCYPSCRFFVCGNLGSCVRGWMDH